MSDKKEKIRCKYYNSGFCKLKSECQFRHPTTICIKSSCENKGCLSRHPKPCCYKDQCRKRSICVYDRWERPTSYPNINSWRTLEAKNPELRCEISDMKAKIEDTKAQLDKVYQDKKEIDAKVETNMRVESKKYQ